MATCCLNFLVVLRFSFPELYLISRFFGYQQFGVLTLWRFWLSVLLFFFSYLSTSLRLSFYLDIVVDCDLEGAPALLRRWGGNGPIGWRANVSPWFRTPLFGSSFSIDDGFGITQSFTHFRIVLSCTLSHTYTLSILSNL